MRELLLSAGIPAWAETLLAFGCGAMGAGLGYLRGSRWSKERVTEEVEHQILVRRNELLDRGRTTERRPEHDALRPARIGRVKYVGTRPRPADRPRNQGR